MNRKILVVIIILAIAVGLILWIFISGGPIPWVSKFTAQRYCDYRNLPKSQVACTEEFKQMYPEECINGYRMLCHGKVDNGVCYETDEDRFDECMSNLVYFGGSENFCNLIINPTKKSSCLSR